MMDNIIYYQKFNCKNELIIKQWQICEDKLLIHLVNIYGNHWTFLKYFFPERTIPEIRNRYKFLQKRQ